jgi:hypothetical protein
VRQTTDYQARILPATPDDPSHPTPSHPGIRLPPALVYPLIFGVVYIAHLPLLSLPYFWDEAGYYVPAARDLLLTGSLIPHSTVSNAHPPLVMAYLALWWKLLGYHPAVTRSAMLWIASFGLAGLFRLARRIANVEVAVASTLCTALYPVFFAQSSLAHVDLAAAALTFWALYSYFEERPVATACWFSLAALAKETAVLAPLALFLWETSCHFMRKKRQDGSSWLAPRKGYSLELLLPLVPLAVWYAYHYRQTGYVFGNPEFFRYNVQSTLNPLRILLALGLRLWQTFGYMQLGLLTLAMLLAMWRPAQRDKSGERPRIAVATQLALLAVVSAYILAMSFIGGAVLARYMLPLVPLVIIVAISTLWRRVHYWRAIVLIVVLAFIVSLFRNPPYGFSMEDNLAYRDYIVLHEDAARFLESRYSSSRVLTAWPASDEITRPYLDYVRRPLRVFRIEDFTVDEIMSAADMRSRFDVALVFSTKYEPPRPLLDRWSAWEHLKTRFFGFHRDVPPAAAAQLLGGEIVFTERREGQWIAVIEIARMQEARFSTP